MFESIMYKISPILHKAFFVMAIVALFDAIFLFVSGEILAGVIALILCPVYFGLTYIAKILRNELEKDF